MHWPSNRLKGPRLLQRGILTSLPDSPIEPLLPLYKKTALLSLDDFSKVSRRKSVDFGAIPGVIVVILGVSNKRHDPHHITKWCEQYVTFINMHINGQRAQPSLGIHRRKNTKHAKVHNRATLLQDLSRGCKNNLSTATNN